MPRVRYLALGSLILGASLGAPPCVRADLVPPGLAECVGKAKGAACDGGICRARTCNRLDYEHPDADRDGGPSSVSYDCTLCEAGSADAGAVGPDTSVPVPEADSGCGSCSSTGAGSDFGARAGALAFALCTGLWLGGFLRRPRR